MRSDERSYRKTDVRPEGKKEYFTSLGGAHLKFPRPKDMKYSVTVQIEEEKENGETKVYEFTGDFTLDMGLYWVYPIASYW